MRWTNDDRYDKWTNQTAFQSLIPVSIYLSKAIDNALTQASFSLELT